MSLSRIVQMSSGFFSASKSRSILTKHCFKIKTLYKELKLHVMEKIFLERFQLAEKIVSSGLENVLHEFQELK